MQAYDIIIQGGQSNSEGSGLGPVEQEYVPSEDILYLDVEKTTDPFPGGLNVIYADKPFQLHKAEERLWQEKYLLGDLALTFSKKYIEKYCQKKIDNEAIVMPHKVTYKKIQQYIKEKYGLHAHSSYIAEVKRKHGIEMMNIRSKEGARVHHPTEKMTEAIEDALRYFNMI